MTAEGSVPLPSSSFPRIRDYVVFLLGAYKPGPFSGVPRGQVIDVYVVDTHTGSRNPLLDSDEKIGDLLDHYRKYLGVHDEDIKTLGDHVRFDIRLPDGQIVRELRAWEIEKV